MIYELAHILQKRFKPIWSIIEWANARLFQARYGRNIKEALHPVLERYHGIKVVDAHDIPLLSSFFSDQPQDAFTYFKPHGFDEESLNRLLRNHAYLLYTVERDDRIVGYFFLRCFFIGKCYLGKMVDHQYQGKGIGKEICCCAMDIASSLGLRMFETISKDNLASLYSTSKVLDIQVVKEMKNNYLYIEDIRKKQL